MGGGAASAGGTCEKRSHLQYFEGSRTPSNSITGNVGRLTVGVRVWTQNIKSSIYRAEEQVGRTGQGRGRSSGLVYYLRFGLMQPRLV